MYNILSEITIRSPLMSLTGMCCKSCLISELLSSSFKNLAVGLGGAVGKNSVLYGNLAVGLGGAVGGNSILYESVPKSTSGKSVEFER